MRDHCIYISDLDSTLLTEGKLSDDSVTFLAALRTKGVQITYTTARGFQSLCRALKDISIDLPVVAVNGAVVVDPVSSHVLALHTLEASAVRTIVERCHAFNLGFSVLRSNGLQDFVEIPNRTTEFMNWTVFDLGFYQHQSVLPVADVATGGVEDVVRVTVGGIEGEVSAFLKDLRSQRDHMFSLVEMACRKRPGYTWVEIGALLADKATGIETVLKQIKRTWSDVVYYGDGLNDISALAKAGEAVAVGETETEVALVADRHIDNTDGTAVVRDIARLEGLELSL